MLAISSDGVNHYKQSYSLFTFLENQTTEYAILLVIFLQNKLSARYIFGGFKVAIILMLQMALFLNTTLSSALLDVAKA